MKHLGATVVALCCPQGREGVSIQEMVMVGLAEYG